MDRRALQKLFGVGPIGAVISLILLAVAVWTDRLLGHPEILKYRSVMEALGALLVCAGLVLHVWTMYVLRNWWRVPRFFLLCYGSAQERNWLVPVYSARDSMPGLPVSGSQPMA